MATFADIDRIVELATLIAITTPRKRQIGIRKSRVDWDYIYRLRSALSHYGLDLEELRKKQDNSGIDIYYPR